MAISSTIFKVDLKIADIGRHYYQDHKLTIAQHPSETALRMLVRLFVFALNASERLAFTKGLSTDEEPDLWLKNLTDDIELWIDLGQPSLKRIRKACSVSERVKIYTFSGHGAEIWWQQNKADVQRFDNLEVIDLDATKLQPLTEVLARTLSLQFTLQEGSAWFGNEAISVELTPRRVK